MKFLLSLPLSFLLFAAASSFNASFFFAEGRTAEDPTPPPALDATGAPLQFGAPYYMLPFPWAPNGGVSLADATPSQPCPKLIQVSPAKTDLGTPVVFSSKVQNVTGNVTALSELFISFYNLTRPNDELCGGSNSTWAVTGPCRSNLPPCNLGVIGEKRTTFLLNPCLVVMPRSYCLIIFDNKFPIMVDESRNLVMTWPSGRDIRPMPFEFQQAKSSEEDEDDKPVIIQMPRKMSV